MTLSQKLREQVDQTLSRLDGIGEQPIGLAVSGGGDSVAMLHLVRAALPNSQIRVATVNHNLRPEAQHEIELVQRHCAALGVSCDVLDWHWSGEGNLQASARNGRWNLMCRWANEHSVALIMLGHTADDQAETFLLRLARGSGVDGLAGMRYSNLRNGLRVVRPILDCARSDLRDWLADQGIDWADDKSNEDPIYDRVRARQLAATLSELGLTQKRILQTVQHMQDAARVNQSALLDFAQMHVEQIDGDVVIGSGDLLQSPMLRSMVAHAVQWIGGAGYKPRLDSLDSVIERCAAGKTATLGGCILMPYGEGLRLTRECAAASIAQWADGLIWDRRWQLSASGEVTQDHEIKALGENGIALISNWRDVGMPRETLKSTPSVWSKDTLIAAPIAGYNNGWSARIVADFKDWLVTH